MNEYPENLIGGRKLGSPQRFPQLDRKRKTLLAAILAVSPLISSCNDVETQKPNIESVEKIEGLGKIQLYADGKDWYVEGEYARDFKLKVFADEKLVYEELFQAGVFFEHKPVGFNAKKITIEAYNPDGSNEQIKISSDPGPEGMLGIPVVYITL